ncbi:unnamed protein product [Polarella glacialis]|uniref:SGNH domain-containing protein n=1 Tax=Polarella glacialis TaxID=89957 RepID=A0A813FB70_POLGL|nr:unnamed protein product [Polarella glacialis]
MKAFALLGAVSFGLCSFWGQSEEYSTWSFYLLFSRFWELVVGVFLSYALSRHQLIINKMMKRRGISIFTQAAAMSLLFAALAFTPTQGFPYPWALLPVIAAVLFIIAGVSERSFLNRVFSQFGLVFVGQISYPIYLWHQPVLAILRHVVDEASVWGPGLVLTLLLSLASHYLIEKRTRTHKQMQGARVSRVLALWLGSALVTYGLLRLLKDHVCLHSVIFGTPFADTADMPLFEVTANHGCACRVVVKTFHNPPAGEPANDSNRMLPPCFYNRPPGWSRYNWPRMDTCFDALTCLAPSRKGLSSGKDGAVILIGDSHAYELSPAIQAATFLPVFMLQAKFDVHGDDPGGDDYRKFRQVLQQVLWPGDVVIFHYYYWRFQASNRHYWTELFTDVLHIVKERNASLLLLSDVPVLRALSTQCLPSFFKPQGFVQCGTSVAETRGETAILHELLAESASQGADVFDIQPLLCDGDGCNERVPGIDTMAYWDGHHLNRAGSNYLAPFLCSYFKDHGMVPTTTTPTTTPPTTTTTT